MTVLGAILASGITWIALRLFKKLYSKHPLDSIPGPSGGSFIAGHFDRLWDQDGWNYHGHLATTYANVVRIRAPFGQRALFVHDSKSLYHILVKDQHKFEETPGFLLGTNLLFGPGLLATLGEQHRKQRKMLNPVFSTTHMREMAPIFYEVTFKLRDTLIAKVSDSPTEIDISKWMTRTSLELVGQSGLGYSFDSLTEHEQEGDEYVRATKRFNDLVSRVEFARQYILPRVYNLATPGLRRRAIDFIPWKALHDLRDVADVLHETAVKVIESKQDVLTGTYEEDPGKIGRGKDIISILVKANAKASEGERLSEEELVGQVSTLTFAATDTTSNALSRTLYLLSQNQVAQETLREEIRDAQRQCGTETLGHDALVALPYLDAVCRETLRLHPPVPTSIRETREDAILPLSKPICGEDRAELNDVFVPKGTLIFLSLLSCNRSPDIWGPDSLEWRPERWIKGLPDSVAKARVPGVSSHVMTFLGGGRACIGFKFAQLAMKVILCALVANFKFSPAQGKVVEWKMTGIVTPAVVGEEGQQLPLIVSIAD